MERGKPENLEKNPRGKGENNTSNKLDFCGGRKTREPGEKPWWQGREQHIKQTQLTCWFLWREENQRTWRKTLVARERTTHQTNSTDMLIFMEGGKPENLEKNPGGKGENNIKQTQLTCWFLWREENQRKGENPAGREKTTKSTIAICID